MKKILSLFFILFLFPVFSYANEDMVKGNKQYKKNNFDKAIECYEKAKEKNNNDAMINYNLANAYYRKGEYDKAMDTYKEVLNNTKDIISKDNSYINIEY